MNKTFNMRSIKKLPPKSARLFRLFIKAPTMWKKEVKSLHPNDWKKLYIFVIHCSRYNVSLTTYELTRLLKEYNFSEELTDEISILYKHGKRLLNLR